MPVGPSLPGNSFRNALSAALAVFFRVPAPLPAPAPADLTGAYRREFPDFPEGCRVLASHPVWGPEVRAAVRSAKYGGSPVSAALVAEGLAALAPLLPENSLVTFVPGTRFQYLFRAWNPSRRAAGALAGTLGTRAVPLLEKVRRTPRQAKLGRAARLAAQRGAFRAAAGAEVRGRHVVVADDVVTTGSTFRACAEPLLAAGAASVTGAFFAAGGRGR